MTSNPLKKRYNRKTQRIRIDLSSEEVYLLKLILNGIKPENISNFNNERFAIHTLSIKVHKLINKIAKELKND